MRWSHKNTFCLPFLEHHRCWLLWQFVYLERFKLYSKEIRWYSWKIQGPSIRKIKGSISYARITWLEWRRLHESQIYFFPGTVSRRPDRQPNCSLSVTWNVETSSSWWAAFEVQILWRKVWWKLPDMVLECCKRFKQQSTGRHVFVRFKLGCFVKKCNA